MFERLRARLERASFPPVGHREAEAHKVAVLRIAVGLVLSWRCALLLRDSYYYFDPVPLGGGEWPLHVMAAAAQLALALGVAIGMRPALCATLLMATHPAYSIWTGTYNLGPMLLTPTLGALAVLDTGRLTPFGRLRPAPPAAHYRAVYLIVFVAYASWNFQALLYHVRDDYWISGQTAAVLFTSSYLSEFYGFFRAWQTATPYIYALLSIAIVVGQSVFQVAMVPLTALPLGARFVHWWGWAFILSSLADLQLSILPVVEAIMWALVFSPARWFGGSNQWPKTGVLAGALPGRAVAVRIFCGVYAGLLLFYNGNGMSRFVLTREVPFWVSDSVLSYSGLVAPNVFNRADLSMGDRWPVLERLDGPRSGQVPFSGPDGERLAYHRGDLLYFANGLVWRRSMIGVGDLEAYHQPGGGGYAFAHQVALYDFRRHGASGTGLYRCTLFRNRSSVAELGPDPARYEPEFVFEFTVQVGSP